MKKVSLITLQAIRNYGSVLQTFATQIFFETNGYEVEVVNFIRPDAVDKNLLNTWTERDVGLKKYLKKAALIPTKKKWVHVFDKFLQNNVHLTHHVYIKNSDFEDYPIYADYYCVGSDQVWNSSWNKGIILPFYLNFAPKSKPKVAFASSFGKEYLDSKEEIEVKPLLEKFSSLSVRESSAIDILKSMGISGAEQLLDPTLLLDRTFWQKFASKRVIRQKYILVYQLNSNKEFDRYAFRYAKEHDMKLIRICTRYDQMIKNGKSIIIPEVREFVSLFMYADCIITDSFHGTAFSINLNRPFISIFPENFSTRIESILKLTNLNDRRLVNTRQNMSLSNIDFAYANKMLEMERKKAREFVENSFA